MTPKELIAKLTKQYRWIQSWKATTSRGCYAAPLPYGKRFHDGSYWV